MNRIPLLRLFNAVEVFGDNENTFTPETIKRMIQNGYVLSPTVYDSNEVLEAIEQVVGLSGEKANAAFHKSWAIVQNSTIEELVIQQVVHYLTTYGFEALGIYSEDTIYIPNEVLEIPEIEDKLSLTVIKGMTPDKILDAIIELGSGVALSSETLKDIMSVVADNNYHSAFITQIKNRELKSLLYKHYDLIPDEPVEFLRYVIFDLTGETLLIKNNSLINKIKESGKGVALEKLMQNVPPNLASIFLRYKPIFLALRYISKDKHVFNRLRKKAEKMHVPLPVDYLGSVTHQIKSGILNFDDLQSHLQKASIYRKARLAAALSYRSYLEGDSPVVYQIRNGKGWATTSFWDSECFGEVAEIALNMTRQSMAKSIQKNVDGKTFYIPENICYTFPATEKQFTGNFPTGTFVTVPEDLIVGIHWENGSSGRTDLDLSLIASEGKLGWDGDYRNEERTYLFSGDNTNAPKPKGASEMFYMRKGCDGFKLLVVNIYNYAKGFSTDCKIFVASACPEKFNKNYVVDPNNIIATANITLDRKESVIGLLAGRDKTSIVILFHTNVGGSVSSTSRKETVLTKEYLIQRANTPILLENIITLAGGIIIRDKSNEDFIDLSPEVLDKSTILKLISE